MNDNIKNEMTLLDTRCWANVVEGLKYIFKDWVREVVEETVSKKYVASTNDTPQYAYSGVELAKYLGCSKSTISRYKLEGKLDGCYKQIDRTIVYDLNSIDKKFNR